MAKLSPARGPVAVVRLAPLGMSCMLGLTAAAVDSALYDAFGSQRRRQATRFLKCEFLLNGARPRSGFEIALDSIR